LRFKDVEFDDEKINEEESYDTANKDKGLISKPENYMV
jgi:hypothetical protein